MKDSPSNDALHQDGGSSRDIILIGSKTYPHAVCAPLDDIIRSVQMYVDVKGLTDCFIRL